MDPIPVPTFSTARLHMRPLGEADEALYRHLYTDPEVMRHIAAPLSDEVVERSFRVACPQAADAVAPMQLWVMSEHCEPGAIGILARMRRADAAESVELGIMLLVVAQGRGFAAEALTALANLTFDARPGCLLWTRHAPGNGAMAGVMHKLGFVPADEGRADATEWRWQVTREQWLARHDEAGRVVIAVTNG